MIQRRGLLAGLLIAGLLIAGMAPGIVRASSLMKSRILLPYGRDPGNSSICLWMYGSDEELARKNLAAMGFGPEASSGRHYSTWDFL